MKYLNIFIAITSIYTSALNVSPVMAAPNEADGINHEELSETCAKSLTTIYGKINKNWKYATDSSVWDTEAISWEFQYALTNRGSTHYLRLKEETQSEIQEALESILNSHTSADCMNAAKIARIKLISDILGFESMNALVTTLGRSCSIDSFQFWHSISWAFHSPCSEDHGGTYFVPFVNLPEYQKFKPDGDAINHNVFRLPNGEYIGFDPDFFTQSQSYDELERYMFEALTSNEYVQENKVGEHKDFCEKLTFEEFRSQRRAYQANFAPYTLDITKINRFIGTGN